MSILHLHPSDAAPARYQTGDRVLIFNDRGGLLLKAEIGVMVSPGVARSPSTRWAKRASDGCGANVLASATGLLIWVEGPHVQLPG